MSKPETPDQPAVLLDPAEQLRVFATQYSDEISKGKLGRFRDRTESLGLHFKEDELIILAALDNPEKVQNFLNTQLYYNNDHATPETEETAMSPRRVLQTSRAHCFEGAIFAYAVNYLHGHSPRLVLLEASQDSEHNLVLFQDKKTKLYGVNAHSAFRNLDGRRPEFTTIRAIAESYYPYYYSDRTLDPKDLTLVGYSDPFDLIPKYGVEWISSEEALWEIYHTYIDDSISFHYLFDDSERTHPYPLIRALREQWIQPDSDGIPIVSAKALPAPAQELWQSFWNVYDRNDRRPRRNARAIEMEFQKITGTTPLDLEENADEFRRFLNAGYRVEQLLTKL